jgi:uncharacterized protein (TIGR03089 family)
MVTHDASSCPPGWHAARTAAYPAPVSNFPDLLARRLRHDPGQPFVTYYDDGTGERTELSVTTYANWVAQTANLLVDELMLNPGDVLALRLRTHWLGPVFVGAAWSAGLRIADGASDGRPDVVVVGPDARTQTSAGGEVLACSLAPFATRFAEQLPEDVHDFGLLWPGQGDVFVPVEAVELGDAAPAPGRVLTDLDPADEPARELLRDLVAGTGSLVLVGGTATAERWAELAQRERATETRQRTVRG